MRIDIKVPVMGESVSEAEVMIWKKQPGDTIIADEVLVELETDKVTLEVSAPADGILKEIIIGNQETVNSNATLAVMETSGKNINNLLPSTEKLQKKIILPTTTNDVFMNNKLSPSVTKLVKENHINISNITPTGPKKNIIKDDIIKIVNIKSEKNLLINKKINYSEERIKMTRLRKTISNRLKKVQNTAAILTTFNEVDMTSIMNIRNKYKDLFLKKYKIKLGFMSFFIKAVTSALKDIPAVNAEIDGDDIIYKNYYNIAVAIGTSKGLFVPVIQNCDKLSFADIEKSIVNYSSFAQLGKLSIKDMQGGTFTITNGGVYGSLMSTPILNSPQSGILGMHKIQKRAVVINDSIKIRSMMYLAFSYDHRIVDGKEAVTFLVYVKELLEDPKRLILEL